MKMTRQVNDGRHRWVEEMECEGGWGPWGTVVKMDCGRSGRVELPVAGVGRRERIKSRRTSGCVGQCCSSCGHAAGRASLLAKERENNRLLLYFAVRSSVRVRFSRTTLLMRETWNRLRRGAFALRASASGQPRGQRRHGELASKRAASGLRGEEDEEGGESAWHRAASRHGEEDTGTAPRSKLRTPPVFPAKKRGAEQAMAGPR
jgi:hypothetical protein